jgi:fatty-acyl-CoA synthase
VAAAGGPPERLVLIGEGPGRLRDAGGTATMMTTPLQVSRLLEYGSTVHGETELVTWTGADTGPRRTTFAEIRGQAARLAHTLRDHLGVTGDQRVATFMWNNAEHLIAYFAVPSMGAVLHTLNIRLPPRSSSTSRPNPRTR